MPPNQQQPVENNQVPVSPTGTQAMPAVPQAPPMQTAGSAATQPTTSAPATQPNPNTTQNSLLLSELRESMAIMKDGTFRAVIACQSINFDLMSNREREGIEYSYQNFLNSLYFPVQILIRSQKVDIGPYLERLSKVRRNQDNMLLGMLMDDYLDFIDALAQEANIMDKDFYIVVPYFPSGDMNAAVANSKSFFTGLFAGNKNQHIKIDKATYDKAKEELGNRVGAVTSGLFQMGIKSYQLNTKQLAELYYNVYNPDTAVREPLGDFDNFTGTYTQKGQGPAPTPTNRGGA
ncbi:MAG TPA: hypothetical protein VFG56_02055 [Candidatus Saccharimonadales bacterium]|nr:hypothetical protein [Candidatus Saccharimonadales bacterium]